MVRQGEGAAKRHGDNLEEGDVVCRDRYSRNDDDIKAPGFVSRQENERAHALV